MNHGVNKIKHIQKEVYVNILFQLLFALVGQKFLKILHFIFPYHPSFEESKVLPCKHITVSDNIYYLGSKTPMEGM